MRKFLIRVESVSYIEVAAENGERAIDEVENNYSVIINTNDVRVVDTYNNFDVYSVKGE